MTTTATVRVMTPEEIAAKAGGETPFVLAPQRATVFATRAMRLRQLASGHAMADFLQFMAELADAQQTQLNHFPAVPVPDAAAMDVAARFGQPPLPATDWPRDPAWHGVLKALVAELRPRAAEGTWPALDHLAQADEVYLERQADALLAGLQPGSEPLALACAPIVAAALQVYWAHMVLEVQRMQAAPANLGNHASVWARTDDETACPCCGSRPTASITRSGGESLGQRYLHCSLCSTQWHMVRIKCSHCRTAQGLAYLALDAAGEVADDAAADGGRRAAQATLQAETCEACGHYLKIMHTDRDAEVEPVADDLASLTLDLLVADTGLKKHGVNLMLLFGEPPPDDPP
ncbi:MAG: formate dehydrogenase accessory protein FdhE [Vitreoscilla sp.]|nr:formate dehydrogenase accessory protein FdhE [Burkholderiales bacterium]MBP6338863.1 formate dehydrogenase accessory protein FdhE [Vitreoscilla sp.]MBP6675177.1 formate dehydrogenase accessory protein FdhE [Vitreoscilla sp.]